MSKPFITVFTPTYNRRKVLHRVYESLLSQTFQNFEWLIVDDGSTDDTSELVKIWKKEAKFPIEYIKKENGGKHTALYTGVPLAKGELFCIADSDDRFIPRTLEVFYNEWMQIQEEGKEDIVGVWCLCKDEQENIVGDKFPQDSWDANFIDRYYRHSIDGEKWHIEKTDVMREFPFPNIKMGKGLYIGESQIWNKIYKKYRARHINIPLRIYYDSEDGIMNTMIDNPYRSVTERHGSLNEINQFFNYFYLDAKKAWWTLYNYTNSSLRLDVNKAKIVVDIKPYIARFLITILLPIVIIKQIIKP